MSDRIQNLEKEVIRLRNENVKLRRRIIELENESMPRCSGCGDILDGPHHSGCGERDW